MWKVLIVDDEPKIRRGLKKWINEINLPFSVVAEAGNGIEAINIAKEKKPQIYFVDINMPKINGLDFIRQLKIIDNKAIIIIISGYDYFEYARQAIQLQVYDYLLKPVPKTDFYHLMIKVNKELEINSRETNILEKQTVNNEDIKEQKYSAIINRVKDYIDSNYQDFELSLPKISNTFNINKTYLSKLMKKELGYSFIEYVTNIRILKAKELLEEDITEIKMYEISKKVGFRSQHYFSRVFKKHEGISPIDYRNKKGFSL